MDHERVVDILVRAYELATTDKQRMAIIDAINDVVDESYELEDATRHMAL